LCGILASSEAPCFLTAVVRRQESVAPDEVNGDTVGYKQGLAIKTGLQTLKTTNSSTVEQKGVNYMLTLPLQSVDGPCSWFAPVLFLNDSLSTCQVSVARDTCGSNQQLNALMYAQSQTWGTSTGPLVLREQGVAVVAAVSVNYMCSSNSASYVKSSQTYSEAVPPYSTSCFAPLNDCAMLGNCEFNASTAAYTCPDDPVSWSSKSSTPPRCWFDTGFKAPPAAGYNNGSEMCENVVVRVSYNFTWMNQEVVLLNATITLANVSLSASSATEVTQEFEVVFHGVPVAAQNSSDNESVAYYPPSGNLGIRFVDLVSCFCEIQRTDV
jgi:hypothetical protein